MTDSYFAHQSAFIDQPCEIGEGTKIWHFSHVMPNAKIGKGCNLGQNVHVASGVVIGDNVKIQNNVSIYEGTVVEDDVFLGPSCVLTNVVNPRSEINRRAMYERTVLRRGCTVGANATVICGITVGRYAFVAAGAVVSRNVPDYALVVGVPGRVTGWMSRHGHRLIPRAGEDVMVCPESQYRYQLDGGALRCLDAPEDDPLPAASSAATVSYRAARLKAK